MNYSTFPLQYELGDVTSAHEKGDRTDKANYRPVSIPSSILKNIQHIHILRNK